MRLRCDVKVCSWFPGTSNGGESSSSRSCVSTLALVKGGKNPPCSYLIHFSSSNKFGKKYKLKDNVQQTFTKFCSEGKMTVRFKEPRHDLLVKADPILLKAFIRTLDSCLRGNIENLSGPDGLSGLGITPKNATPTKLIITHISQFPVKGLPRTLQTLHINGLGMNLFKREILILRNLHTLDLSRNNLERLPPELGKMPCLSQLVLSENKLGKGQALDWRWLDGPQISNTLNSLDLSSNSLDILPGKISKLKNLEYLKLDNNNLNHLPMSLASITNLRSLYASHNNLSALPANIIHRRLSNADFSYNNLKQENIFQVNPKFEILSLVDLCSSVVVTHKIPYSRSIIPYTLVDYLDDPNFCVCGKPSYNSVNYIRTNYFFPQFCQSVTLTGDGELCLEFYSCSTICHKSYLFLLTRNKKPS